MSRGLFDDQQPSIETESGPGPVAANSPLAERMRPRSLQEMVGQQAVVGEEAFLPRALAEERLPSLILWGPPGCGKTTLAEIVARESSCRFLPFSAVTSGIKEVKAVMADAARLNQSQGRRTLLFVDEIHRFNRAQQDAFLPYVERGEIILVGATTENPSFELNGALLSRCRVVVLEPLPREALLELLQRALGDPEQGLGTSGVTLTEEAADQICQLASGDARRALNLLDLAVADAQSTGRNLVDGDDVARIAQGKTLLYDKSGEEHFNLISALHKSLRESDPDAAIYWLVRMLEAGESPAYVARRLLRFASEDVGLADPSAVARTLAAWDAYDRLGSPEGDLALAQAALYLALAPKSNAAYVAYKAARQAIREQPAEPVPMAIRNAPTRLMKDVGYGEGHVYAHDTEAGMGGMECLPESLQGTRFYQPTQRGVEARLQQRLAELLQMRSRLKQEQQAPE